MKKVECFKKTTVQVETNGNEMTVLWRSGDMPKFDKKDEVIPGESAEQCVLPIANITKQATFGVSDYARILNTILDPRMEQS